MGKARCSGQLAGRRRVAGRDRTGTRPNPRHTQLEGCRPHRHRSPRPVTETRSLWACLVRWRSCDRWPGSPAQEAKTAGSRRKPIRLICDGHILACAKKGRALVEMSLVPLPAQDHPYRTAVLAHTISYAGGASSRCPRRGNVQGTSRDLLEEREAHVE